MTGSDIIIKMLIDEGVTDVFGYPGGAVMPLYDALYRYRGKIKHTRTSHEQWAAHAADGFARASGKIGVSIATSGPGATNLVTGIATAFADSVPVLFITANVTTDEIGTDSFQEADITGITLPVCKYNWIVKNPQDLPKTINKAIKLSKSGRPGPVLVDVPKDILTHEYGSRYDYRKHSETDDSVECRMPEQDFPTEDKFIKIADIINKSKRPFIISGGGVGISGAQKELVDFCEKLNSPVGFTLMSMGIMSAMHPLNVGMLGKYGSETAKKIFSEADTVIACGMRFSNRTHEANLEGKKIIHIDADAAEVNKNVHATDSLIGDAKAVIEKLSGYICPRNSNWAASKMKTTRLEWDDVPGKYSALFGEICKVLGENQFVVTDVGNHQMTVAKFYPFLGKRRFITSGGFGTMGFGIGAAIGAKKAVPDANVVLFTGDASFRMSAVELLTLKQSKIKILIVVMNNQSLGMVRDMQEKYFGGRFYETSANADVPRITALAKAYGLKGRKVSSYDELMNALREYNESKGSYVIDFRE